MLLMSNFIMFVMALDELSMTGFFADHVFFIDVMRRRISVHKMSRTGAILSFRKSSLQTLRD